MSSEWEKQQEKLKTTGKLCMITDERRKAVQDETNAALEKLRQERNKNKV